MAMPKMFLSNTHFALVNMGCVISGFVYRKMVLFGGAFWVFFCAYLLPLFGFIIRNLFRMKGSDTSHKINSNSSTLVGQESIKTDSNCIAPEPEPEPKPELKAEFDGIDIKESEDDESGGKEESPQGFLKFRFQSYEEFSRSYRGNGDSLSSITEPTGNANKYEFFPDEGYSGFMEEPEVSNYTVKELYVNLKDDCLGKEESSNDGFLSEKDFIQRNSAENSVQEETQGGNSEKNLSRDEDFSREVQFHSEDFTVDSDSESITSSHEFSIMNHFMDSNSDGFLSDRDFGEKFELDSLIGVDGETIKSSEDVLDEEDRDIIMEFERLVEPQVQNGHQVVDFFEEEDSDIMEELQKIETECHKQNSSGFESDFLSEKDFHGGGADNDNEANPENDGQGKQQTDHLANSGKGSSQNSSTWESENSHGLETLWEHQDLIEQLKLEIRKVRATGLPTILEESESSPKIMEDLQPWKIEEKFQHEDTLDELHKFYKSYRERMRKFDILNYQKMYAIGFLQSKDAHQSNEASAPTMPSIFLENLSPSKHNKKAESDPMVKFTRELHSDLEMVYVGQMCLSWEFLHWQYDKALELWESDPRGVRTYNQVAGEFQQFQVLMQRFIENEAFQGPRVQNYVKNRCVLRNLLQVPVIREDNKKDKNKATRKGRDEGAITSDILVEVLEESIRIFWRFVRTDKHDASMILKGRKSSPIELQDPADSQLLADVRSTLHKKEKKLKDLLRTGNCILKRFRKNREESSEQVLYFFSQVDMKLVSRVMNMSIITTDQLVWCRNKLSRISFVNRKIHVEPPSFLVFPC